MTRILIGIDDTDVLDAPMGTGKLVRYLEPRLPEPVRLAGVLRHQLLVAPDIPFTSHNSPACALLDAPDESWCEPLAEIARAHILEFASPGSDPGLCIVPDQAVGTAQVAFGLECTRRKVTQDEARQAANGAFVEGLGGTNDGLIGAVAAVGLTHAGWAGRFIELGGLREFPERVSVADLRARGIEPVSLDRDARPLAPEDQIITHDSVRPRHWAWQAVLPVQPVDDGLWEVAHRRKPRQP